MMADACKRLWAAVLEQAIKDAQGKVTAHKGNVKEIFTEGARAWFRSSDQDTGSFLWICSVLSLKPDFIHKLVFSEETPKKPFKVWKNIKTQTHFSAVKMWFMAFILMSGFSCATNSPSTKTATDQQVDQDPIILEMENDAVPPAIVEEFSGEHPFEKPSLTPIPVAVDAVEDAPRPTVAEVDEKTDQERLDTALEFCQASNDFWEQGDLDNALASLDQAYSLILEVKPDQNPEILQQREDLRFTISKRIIECYSSRFIVANGYHKAIPVVMNSHVERALKLFKGRERAFFMDAYRRSGRYRPAIVKALEAAGLPEELSWLPLIESGFKVRALSRARALGMWQFIASTGYKFGLKRDQWVDERMDPEKSTIAAIAYLKELHQIFGDWTTVLAAYNCGEGTVLKRIRTQRINYLDNFWDLYTRLPRETAFYVPKFLAVLHILNDPEGHGFTLPPLDEKIEVEKIPMNKQVHLKTVAKYIEVPYTTLKNLNPALRYNSTPNRAYAINVPKGKGEILLAKLEEIPVWRPPTPAYVVHRVRKGESLSVIAKRYRTSIRKIMAFNGLRSSHYIKAGWRLKIPSSRISASVQKASVKPSAMIMGKGMTYTVRKGDSLWKIATRFGTTTKVLASLNELDSTRLKIGQVLLISKDKTQRGDI